MLKLSFRQQVLTGFAASVILVFVVAILSYSSIQKLEDDNQWVNHTQQVIKNSTNLLQQLIDAETGMRGYAATGNATFLDPYNAALPRIKVNLDSLRNLVSDNPDEVKRANTLAQIVDTQLAILKTDVDTRAAKGLEFMVASHMFLNGKQNMDSIRSRTAEIITEENTLLACSKNFLFALLAATTAHITQATHGKKRPNPNVTIPTKRLTKNITIPPTTDA